MLFSRFCSVMIKWSLNKPRFQKMIEYLIKSGFFWSVLHSKTAGVLNHSTYIRLFIEPCISCWSLYFVNVYSLIALRVHLKMICCQWIPEHRTICWYLPRLSWTSAQSSQGTRWESVVANKFIQAFFQVVLSSSSKYFKDFFRHQPGVNIIDLDKVTRSASTSYSNYVSVIHNPKNKKSFETKIFCQQELAPNDISLTLEDVQLIIGILYCVGTVEISPQRIETLLISAQVARF